MTATIRGDGDGGTVWTFDGEEIHLNASESAALVEMLRGNEGEARMHHRDALEQQDGERPE